MKSLGQVVVNVPAILLVVYSTGKPPAGMLQGIMQQLRSVSDDAYS